MLPDVIAFFSSVSIDLYRRSAEQETEIRKLQKETERLRYENERLRRDHVREFQNGAFRLCDEAGTERVVQQPRVGKHPQFLRFRIHREKRQARGALRGQI